MDPPSCPNCGRVFKDSSAVLKHMNHRYGSCHRWFTDNQPPPPPSQHPQGPTTPASHQYFPGAGFVFGSGAGFMGQFTNDEDADARSLNPYHPFLSRDEWEIAEFLSCSGLSMGLIDNFLSLNSVSHTNSFGGTWTLMDINTRSPGWGSHSIVLEPSRRRWNVFQADRSGSQEL